MELVLWFMHGLVVSRECPIIEIIEARFAGVSVNGDSRWARGSAERFYMSVRITVFCVSVELSIRIPKLKKVTRR